MTSSEPTSRPKVAFLGPISSYSHQSTKSAFPEDEWELSPTVTIKEIFDVVQSGQTQLGVVPFENSTHGPVLFTLDALADRQSQYADLSVVGEIYLDVHHCLLGRFPHLSTSTTQQPSPQQDGGKTITTTTTTATTAATNGQPLASLRHVKKVYSHPQAFGQTQAFFAAHLPGVECIETSSTSKAAELAAADETGSSAAVASAMAAATSRLDVLAANIEDRADNTTRFFVIARGAPGARGGGCRLPERFGLEPDTSSASPRKCLVSFTVPHQAPGALSDVLDLFKTRGLNLTSINTAPSRVRPFQYIFFVEFEGKGGLQSLLEDVERVAERLRYWGSWVKQRD